MSEPPSGGQNPDAPSEDPDITFRFGDPPPPPPGGGEPAPAIKAGILKFDGWDVILGGAIAFLVARAFVHNTPVDLFWVAGGLTILWIIVTILANLGWIPSKRGPS